MKLIDSNTNGRIYISKLSIKKIVFMFLENNYPQINVYNISLINECILIEIHENCVFAVDEIIKIQDEGRKLLSSRLGIYIENININVG